MEFPKHTLIIPDGQHRERVRRAKDGDYLTRAEVYKLGAQKGVDVSDALIARGVDAVTILVTTIHNLTERTREEIEAIYSSLAVLLEHADTFLSKEIAVSVIGTMKIFDEMKDLRGKIAELEKKTAAGKRGQFTLLLGFDHRLHTLESSCLQILIAKGMSEEAARDIIYGRSGLQLDEALVGPIAGLIQDRRTEIGGTLGGLMDLPPVSAVYRTGERAGSVGLSGAPGENAKLIFSKTLWPDVQPDAVVEKVSRAIWDKRENAGGRTEGELVLGDAFESMVAIKGILSACGVKLVGEDEIDLTASDRFVETCEVNHELVFGYIVAGTFNCRAFPDMQVERKNVILLYMTCILLIDLLFDSSRISSAEVEEYLCRGSTEDVSVALKSVKQILNLFKTSLQGNFSPDGSARLIDEIVGPHGIIRSMRQESLGGDSADQMLEISKITIGNKPLMEMILLAGNEHIDADALIQLTGILDRMSEVIRLENDLSSRKKEELEGTGRKNIVAMMVKSGATQEGADRAIKDRIKLGKAYIINMLTSRSYAEGVDDTIRRGIYMVRERS